MLSTHTLCDRGHHESELNVNIRGDTSRGPTSGQTEAHPNARPVQWTGPVIQKSVVNDSR